MRAGSAAGRFVSALPESGSPGPPVTAIAGSARITLAGAPPTSVARPTPGAAVRHRRIRRPRTIRTGGAGPGIWRERVGIEPTPDTRVPGKGFEVLGAHQNSCVPTSFRLLPRGEPSGRTAGCQWRGPWRGAANSHGRASPPAPATQAGRNRAGTGPRQSGVDARRAQPRRRRRTFRTSRRPPQGARRSCAQRSRRGRMPRPVSAARQRRTLDLDPRPLGQPRRRHRGTCGERLRKHLRVQHVHPCEILHIGQEERHPHDIA